jgi:hypothetical protein
VFERSLKIINGLANYVFDPIIHMLCSTQ